MQKHGLLTLGTVIVLVRVACSQPIGEYSSVHLCIQWGQGADWGTSSLPAGGMGVTATQCISFLLLKLTLLKRNIYYGNCNRLWALVIYERFLNRLIKPVHCLTTSEPDA